MAFPFALPRFQAFDASGTPLAGGKLYTSRSGTSTLADTYQDETGTVPNSNPIVLDARGEAALWVSAAQPYRFELRTSADTVIWTQDGVTAVGTPAYTVSVKDYGAVGDGNCDDTKAFANALAHLKSVGGGSLFVPSGQYLVSPLCKNRACITIDFNNVRMFGTGANSVIFTMQNEHVPVHISSQLDLSVQASSGAVIEDVIVQNLHVKGTGVYQYSSLAIGRGILIRRAKNIFIRDNHVTGMSMIGIVVESGQGYFEVTRNRVADCRYTAINYNGRAYNSIIANNICSGSDGGVNSVAIQATGPCIVEGNTVYGDVANYAQCGGIMWGEGNYDGIGAIRGNIVLHCRFGIKTVYHGACVVAENVIINCRTLGGILAIGGTTGDFTVASNNNLITNNMLVNNFPSQIESSAVGCVISGNVALNIPDPVNPSADSEPDAILPVSVQAGIRIRAAQNSLIGNRINGAVRGISTTIGVEDGSIQGNVMDNCTSNYSMEGANNQFVINAARERRSLGSESFIESLVSTSRPATGFFPAGSHWRPSAYALGSPTGYALLQSGMDAVTAAASAGAVSVDIAGAANFISGADSIVGITLDNGAYHWTTLASNSGNTLVLANAIPVGRSVLMDAAVYVNVWRSEAVLV